MFQSGIILVKGVVLIDKDGQKWLPLVWVIVVMVRFT